MSIPETQMIMIVFLSLLLFLSKYRAEAQQSAAGQDTLIAVVGRDYVMMGADSSSSLGGGGISLTSSDIDKLAVVHDGYRHREVPCDNSINAFMQQAIVVGFAGDAADGKDIKS